MSTDICALIEIRDKNGEWQYFRSIDIERNYKLFSILGNVRNFWDAGEFVYISEKRGIPHGACLETKEYLKEYSMMQSYVTLREIFDFDWCQKWRDVPYWFWAESFLTQLMMIGGHKNPEDCRIIFGFDC